MKLEDTDLFIMWLNSMTSKELREAFPNKFYDINAVQSKEDTVNSLLANDGMLWGMCKNHMQLLHKKFEKWMVYPCDKNGEVIEQPTCQKRDTCACGEEQALDCREWKSEYKEAENKILFKLDLPEEGVDLIATGEFKVKYLLGKCNIELTQAGINFLKR